MTQLCLTRSTPARLVVVEHSYLRDEGEVPTRWWVLLDGCRIQGVVRAEVIETGEAVPREEIEVMCGVREYRAALALAAHREVVRGTR